MPAIQHVRIAHRPVVDLAVLVRAVVGDVFTVQAPQFAVGAGVLDDFDPLLRRIAGVVLGRIPQVVAEQFSRKLSDILVRRGFRLGVHGQRLVIGDVKILLAAQLLHVFGAHVGAQNEVAALGDVGRFVVGINVAVDDGTVSNVRAALDFLGNFALVIQIDPLGDLHHANYRVIDLPQVRGGLGFFELDVFVFVIFDAPFQDAVPVDQTGLRA